MTDLVWERSGVGAGGPALVLVHAAVASREMWQPILPTLASEHIVVAYDVRGFGSSPAPTADYFDHDDLWLVGRGRQLHDLPVPTRELATRWLRHELQRAIDVPTLVVVGDRGQRLIEVAARRYADELPNARHEVIADAAHLVSVEQPARSAALTLEHARTIAA